MSWIQQRETTAEPPHRHSRCCCCRCRQLSHLNKNRNKNMEMVSIFVFQISHNDNRDIYFAFTAMHFITFISVWTYISTLVEQQEKQDFTGIAVLDCRFLSTSLQSKFFFDWGNVLAKTCKAPPSAKSLKARTFQHAHAHTHLVGAYYKKAIFNPSLTRFQWCTNSGAAH